MARINLLPWRAERQKERKKQFFMMLALSAFAGLAAWFIINTYYNNQISGQQARNAFIDQEIVAVKTKITEIEVLEEKKNKLLNRKKVIEELQANRSQMVHLFDSLVRTIPDGVILTSIKQEGDKLTLEGRSQSNARVSTYMRNFETSGWMTKPDLSVIQAEGDDKGLPYTFSLVVTLANPNAKKEGEEVDATAAGIDTTAAAPATLQPLSPAQPAAPAAKAPVSPAVSAPATSQPAESAPAKPSGGAEL
jgi:type IV pilus assembly protein PilN